MNQRTMVGLPFFAFLTLLIPSTFGVSYDEHGRIELHIGGIFPMSASISGWAGGQACLPAALMALDDINNRHDVIPGYKLVLHGHKNDSRVRRESFFICMMIGEWSNFSVPTRPCSKNYVRADL